MAVLNDQLPELDLARVPGLRACCASVSPGGAKWSQAMVAPLRFMSSVTSKFGTDASARCSAAVLWWSSTVTLVAAELSLIRDQERSAYSQGDVRGARTFGSHAAPLHSLVRC